MSKHMTRKTIVAVTILAIVGFGTYAFAGWGMDYHRSGRGHHGPGWHHGGWGGPGYGYMMGDLSDDEIAAMEKERNSFIEATENLRQDIYRNDLELRSELAKENPDIKKAGKIQKEISDLEAKIEQKRIDHMIKMKKINPNMGKGYGSGRGRGYGGGPCWR
ncbi:MAG: periplasmic heavy metal sensor [Desulfobacterales bacterium]|nr:MAG: periplasmic heavy metal sensor [Desulfobacterales bacterium]